MMPYETVIRETSNYNKEYDKTLKGVNNYPKYKVKKMEIQIFIISRRHP